MIWFTRILSQVSNATDSASDVQRVSSRDDARIRDKALRHAAARDSGFSACRAWIVNPVWMVPLSARRAVLLANVLDTALRAADAAAAALITCVLGSDVMGAPAVEKNLCHTYFDDGRSCV